MIKVLQYLVLILGIISTLCLDQSFSADKVYEINEIVEDNVNYKKAEFGTTSASINHYFKYQATTIPSSKIGAFRINFDQFSELALEKYFVYCTFVDNSASDDTLISKLREIDSSTSSCVGSFASRGVYDGIIKYEESNKKLGIYLITAAGLDFTARLYLRTTETILEVNEQKVIEDENYSLIPYTIVISNFRDDASKIFFYSHTRELQMYFTESTASYPEKLFSGNILNVFTNPNMVRQKYRNANIMSLLSNSFGAETLVGEEFFFQVKFFSSQYLIDYFVSSNPDGRNLNSPLSLNMTQCDSPYPYFVILNYNKPENKVSLFIDQIYGQIRSIKVATSFTQSTWEEMLKIDMKEVDLLSLKHEMARDQIPHMDVFKIECELPLLLNFYYTDETAPSVPLNSGDISILTLKSYQTVTVPFDTSIMSPEITIDIYDPFNIPFIIIDDGQNENVYKKNTVVRIMPWNLNQGIIFKERGGSSSTRAILKVGYTTDGWEEQSEYIKYNPSLNIYVYAFPNDDRKYNYTYVSLRTSGTNDEDNVKYCYITNIGAALKPSEENCYRVSSNNSYTLKVLNPLIMYKDYELDDQLTYYVTFKPTQSTDKLTIDPFLTEYNTEKRNYEGVNNMITIGYVESYSTILTAPLNKDPFIFAQVQVCSMASASMEILNAYDNSVVVEKTTIPKGSANFYQKFENIYLETELKLTGTEGLNIFVKHVGIPSYYTPDIKSSFKVEFHQNLNELLIENPLNNKEKMKLLVLVDKEGVISSKQISLCSFAEFEKPESLAIYSKTVYSTNDFTSVQINFQKAGFSVGENFEAIVYIEQQENSKMSFLSEIVKGTVGKIETDTIYSINEPYSQDKDYLFKYLTADSSTMSYYFSYLPSSVFTVPFGAFRVEIDSDATGYFSSVDCTFVNEDDDPMTMIEAVEEAIEKDESYCIGSRSNVDQNRYDYIFKYKYDESNPKKMVIKISNGGYVNGGFSVYMKNGEGTQIEKTDMKTQKEYGEEEESKKSVIPYIVDLEAIRGESETGDDKVSKILFYSQHLEMQMYYLDENNNSPIRLFTGNIMLVYTKPDLAIQKYHATTLILLSENLEGQQHASIGNRFRFHTKMFKTEDQIEYFVSANPEGRTLNYPLSIEMNTCSNTNNKFYYILNYNKEEEERTLHLDMIFGAYKTAKIVNEINTDKWDSLISLNMKEIVNYEASLPKKSQHIDVVEIECQSPLLVNVYYNYEKQKYDDLKKGDIIVKKLGSNESTSFTLDSSVTGSFFYSISLFNPKETPDVTVRFNDGTVHSITENALQIGMLFRIPEIVYVTNNINSETRFIFKIGLGVESEWSKEQVDIDGELYTNSTMFVYKFPSGKLDYKNVKINVKSLENVENVKFCYSSNIGMAIGSSRENCFRTGKNIPYELTFTNPLIIAKNYKSYSDNYYISLSPFDNNQVISLEITENKYTTTERNKEGIHNVLTLKNNEISTILSLPEQETTKIMVHMFVCLSTSTALTYVNYDAYSGEQILEGVIKYGDPKNYYLTSNVLTENQLKLTGGNVKVYTKHVGVGNYVPNIVDYKSTFDSTKNVVSIVKPIYNEEFTITVIVGRKNSLSDVTLCTIAETDDKTSLGDYVATFTSTSSNDIVHYISFKDFGYQVDDEFDLLVYAEQTKNSKMEFTYPLISDKVGKISGVIEINEKIEEEVNLVTKEFAYNSGNNYLYYDFGITPNGKVASLKINSPQVSVTKVGCVFMKSTGVDDGDMVNAVNTAVREGKSVCLGQSQKDGDGFDALINANYTNGNNRLVIQIMYGFSDNNSELKDEESTTVSINLRTSGFSIDSDSETKYNEVEKLSSIPYVIDLEKIREHRLEQDEYVSKVMFYSSTREMQMFYIDQDSPTPVELFSGYIMLVYTNPELIIQKYHGATTMILLTDALSSTSSTVLGEQFRFRVQFFNSAKSIQYYVSGNPNGRLLNNPTSIEMLSCDQPYYYILNYYYPEEENRQLHIDTIFGEISTIKMAMSLTQDNWEDLVGNMEQFEGNQVLLNYNKFHMDVIEVKCKLPLLLNLYYVNPDSPKLSNLEIGDISIISLRPSQSQTLSFKTGLKGPFVYSFNIYKEVGQQPNIQTTFEDESYLDFKENGVYTKDSIDGFTQFTIKNREVTGTASTRIIFKFGYVIESKFKKIQNDIYHNQGDGNRTINLFGYKFETNEARLNYTSVDFLVETTEDNVKFCYSTNLGTYINPSLQNCFRVGKKNSYTISVLNPLVMYKNYYNDDVINYYVGFRTVELEQNITITPKLNKYSTEDRNVEGGKKKITLTSQGTFSTILTAPKNKEEYIFVHMHVCTKNEGIRFDFLNAYNLSSLGYSDEIQANSKNNFRSIPNTKLDTELDIKGKKGVDVFIKHVGIKERYQPVVKDIEVTYDNETKTVTFNQPIEEEEFKYTIYLDKKGNLQNKGYTLCSLVDISKLAHYQDTILSSEANPQFKLDFNKKDLQGYEDFDIMILAEQSNNGKLTILSSVYNKEGKTDDGEGGSDESNSNIGLIIIIIILSVLLIALCIAAFFFFRNRYMAGKMKHQIEARAASLAEISGSPQDKLITSQVDP